MKALLLLLSFGMTTTAFGASTIEGTWKLDFYASSGSCSSDAMLALDSNYLYTEQMRITYKGYRFGNHCHDRTQGGQADPGDVAPELCSNAVETNTISADLNSFTHERYRFWNIGGSQDRRTEFLSSIVAVSDSRLQTEAFSFDREGKNPTPLSRCFYDRVR